MTAQSTVAQPAPTLIDALVPPPSDQLRSAVRAMILVVGGAALTAGAAQVAFTTPWTPVPYTGQTAAVLLVGTVLGMRLGAAAMGLYLLAGTLGLPVYADGDHGVARLLGATGGYLVGFIAAAALVGWLAQRRWDRSVRHTAALMILGNLVIYATGVPVLMLAAGMPAADALWRGALVFLPWDAAKILAAALLLPVAWRVARRGSGR